MIEPIWIAVEASNESFDDVHINRTLIACDRIWRAIIWYWFSMIIVQNQSKCVISLFTHKMQQHNGFVSRFAIHIMLIKRHKKNEQKKKRRKHEKWIWIQKKQQQKKMKKKKKKE